MNRDSHVSRVDLLEFIDGTGDAAKTQSIGEHVHRCKECRKALDALTAPSAIWQWAPILLSGSVSNDIAVRDDISEQWRYPIDKLFESPVHPELLGRLGKYDVEREVGRGGMGVVFKAYDSELHRAVAIKVLAPHVASHASARKRFAQEAIAAAAVFHPNVIPVHGVDSEGRTPYIVMHYIDGPSLQTLVEQNGPLTEIEIARIALQISAGLAAAHAQGLVHRDIKPANVLVEVGVNRVMITDFGLARAVDDASMTRTGWLTGTPNYMSPEQTRGERLDPRSDLFSLGSLIYFMATGRLPFRADSPLGVLHRIQIDEPLPVQEANHRISRTLSDIIKKLLTKSLDARFQSAAEVHSLFEKHLAYLHQPETQRPPKVLFAENKTRRVFFSATGLGVLMIATSAAIFFSDSYKSLSILQLNTWPEKGLSSNNTPKDGDEVIGDLDLAVADRLVSRAKLEANQGNYVAAEDLCRRALQANPENDDAATNLGYALAMQNRHEEAFPWHERAAKSVEFQPLGNYNLACHYSRKNEADLAISFLRKSIAQGLSKFLSIHEIEVDPDLGNVRNDSRYVSALELMRSGDQSQ